MRFISEQAMVSTHFINVINSTFWKVYPNFFCGEEGVTALTFNQLAKL